MLPCLTSPHDVRPFLPRFLFTGPSELSCTDAPTEDSALMHFPSPPPPGVGGRRGGQVSEFVEFLAFS